ncbi:MAG: glycosyltransferase family 1 protein [Bryobacteraceae bacterium]
MTFALDGTPLTEPTGGVARYTWELARSLADLYPGDDYWLLSDQTFAMPLDRPSNLHGGGRPQSAIDRRWWLWGLQHEMQRRRVQLFHGTDFSVPYVPRGRPSVMTVHDLSPWMDASWNHATSRVRSRTPLLLRLGLAKMVITPSEAVRKATIEQFQLAPETVVSVPHAARELFHPVEAAPTPVPYFLFVGTLEGRKNISGLIEAWRAIREQVPVELWLVGRMREGFSIPEHEGLRHLSGIDDAALPGLYSGATAFVYPSHYEGFGLPVLEAMQCGCPVITSNDPAITEVAGEAAIHVDAADVAALSAAMRTLLTDASARDRLRASGLQRAAQFHWRETARRTREVYAAALA